jgi:hypothetical protein
MNNNHDQPGDDAITGWIHETIENALAEGWHRPIVLMLRPAVEHRQLTGVQPSRAQVSRHDSMSRRFVLDGCVCGRLWIVAGDEDHALLDQVDQREGIT